MTEEISPEYKLKSYIVNPAHHVKTGAIKAFFKRADFLALFPSPADSRQGVIDILQYYGLEVPEDILIIFISEFEAARPNVPKWQGRQAAPVIPGQFQAEPNAEPNPEKAESLEHSHGSQASDRPQGLAKVQAGDFSGLAGWDLQANEQRGNTEGPADPGLIKEIENISNRINNISIFFFLWIEAAYKFPGLIDTWNKAIKTEKNQFVKSVMIMGLTLQNVPEAKTEILQGVSKLAEMPKLLNDFKNKKETELLTALQVIKGLAKDEIKAIKTIKSEYKQIIQVFKLTKSPELRQKIKTLFELSTGNDFKTVFPVYGLQADLLIYLTMAARSPGFISLCQTIKDLLDVQIPADKETEINDTLAALYPSYLLPELGKPKAALNYELGRDLLTKELFFPAQRAARQIKADPRQGLFKFMFLFPTKKIKTGTAEISILFDVSGLAALSPEERRINEYDALIHNVISSIYNAGNDVISINQIYEKMGYSRETMTKEARAAIIKSIDKMRKTDIIAGRTDGDIKAFPGGFQSYRGAILQAEYFTGHRNGKIIDCVRIARQPILNQIPKERNMMYYVNFDLLKLPYHFTNENIRLWHILVQRLGLMKHTGQNLLSLESFFKECEITGKEKRRQTKKKIIKTLELFCKGGGNAECDLLQGFTEIEAEGGGTAFKIDFKKDCQ